MVYQRMRGVAMVCGVAATLLAVPAETNGCRFLSGLCGGARTTYRAPYVASYAPVYRPAAPCVPQTCRYVPQTCYRTVYRCVPTTACVPMTCCDPCTGCPVTTYRPVTTWTRRATLVPYTTYRLVRTNPCNPYVSYGSYTRPVSAAPSSCCAPAASVPAMSAPVTGGTLQYPAPSTSTPPPTSTPSTGTAPKTFQEGSQPAEETPLTPIPDANTQLNSTPSPSLIDPGRDRTTSQPARQTTRLYLVASSPKPVAVRTTAIDDGGWRASSD